MRARRARPGTQAASSGVASLDRAAAHLKALPVTGDGAALAAHATPEGHWKFVNRAGEVFTAGTPDELTRAVPTLLPDAAADARLTLYLTEDTVFGERALLKDLPETRSPARRRRQGQLSAHQEPGR